MNSRNNDVLTLCTRQLPCVYHWVQVAHYHFNALTFSYPNYELVIKTYLKKKKVQK